jgi:hypothetical protein
MFDAPRRRKLSACNLACPLAGFASLVMVCVILDLHDERHAVLGPPRQVPVRNVRAIEEGVQLAQVTARKPHVYTVPNNRSEHVFFSHFCAQRTRLDRDDHRNVATTIVNAHCDGATSVPLALLCDVLIFRRLGVVGAASLSVGVTK